MAKSEAKASRKMTGGGLKSEANFKAGIFQEYFGTSKFSFQQELDRIDFIITDNSDRHLIWAETKKNTADVTEMFVQLILTIGKARTFDKINPPPFLCVFDYEKIAFLQYNAVHDIFYQTDFNWNIAPSDHKSKEFLQIKEIVEKTVAENKLLFFFDKDKAILKEFIKNNFFCRTENDELFTRLQIDKNNFVPTYNRWLEMVKPSINIDWDKVKSKGIIDADFYLADLLSEKNVTIKQKLYVLLKKTKYELDRRIDDMGLFASSSVEFKDNGVAHMHFWARYVRPPKKEYWDYIVDRRDLLVPQDIRERKGSFFTPQIWVQKSQDYLTKVFGENWQEEYYVWDCAAGTGNLLVGLTNKYNIWASTLDKQDVDVMKDRIANGANLLAEHVFQFDFLNDDFDKLPKELKAIIDDKEKRKKLIVYINPPYAEATSSKTISNANSRHKKDVAISNIKEKYEAKLSQGVKELYVQFLFRIYNEINGCFIGNFSTAKILLGTHSKEFREYFKANLKIMFIVPSYTFDNVSGKFPIGFFIWDTQIKSLFKNIEADIYDQDGKKIGKKSIFAPPGQNIKDWLRKYKTTENPIGYLVRGSSDIQNSNIVFLTLKPSESVLNASNASLISKDNLFENSIFFTIRKIITKTWINDRDQFLFPNSKWEDDGEFKTDCLAFALLDQSNTVKSSEGTNHWIPFTAREVDAKSNFESTFMSDFIKGRVFSAEAQAVLDSGKELWKYYHAKIKEHTDLQKEVSVNASFYDIREYFQGRNEKGNMNQKSTDEIYNALIKDLRLKLSALAEKIKPKVYEYGFLAE